MTTLDGRLVTPAGVRPGRIRFGTRIEALEPLPGPLPEGAPTILPGFVDAHVHGGGGGDAMDGPDGVRALARAHLAHGTTTLLPTTITNPWERIVAALEGIRAVRAAADPELPDLPGAHLEGPFLSPERLGAQPPHALEPTPERVDALLALGVVRVVTLAPDVAGAAAAARRFAAAGVRVSLGHTVANADRVAEVAGAVRAAGGAVGFTHLFNAMGGMAGRDPGVVGAALADEGAWAELILDGHHVHPVSFLAALRAKRERLLLVTDAMRATATNATESELGGQPVRIEGGAARLEDGTLAGSVLTQDAALRNALAAGVSLEDASHALSGAPAAWLGLADRGALEPGRRADLVVLAPDLRVARVFVAGREMAR